MSGCDCNNCEAAPGAKDICSCRHCGAELIECNGTWYHHSQHLDGFLSGEPQDYVIHNEPMAGRRDQATFGQASGCKEDS